MWPSPRIYIQVGCFNVIYCALIRIISVLNLMESSHNFKIITYIFVRWYDHILSRVFYFTHLLHHYHQIVTVIKRLKVWLSSTLCHIVYTLHHTASVKLSTHHTRKKAINYRENKIILVMYSFIKYKTCLYFCNVGLFDANHTVQPTSYSFETYARIPLLSWNYLKIFFPNFWKIVSL